MIDRGVTYLLYVLIYEELIMGVESLLETCVGGNYKLMRSVRLLNFTLALFHGGTDVWVQNNLNFIE